MQPTDEPSRDKYLPRSRDELLRLVLSAVSNSGDGAGIAESVVFAIEMTVHVNGYFPRGRELNVMTIESNGSRRATLTHRACRSLVLMAWMSLAVGLTVNDGTRHAGAAGGSEGEFTALTPARILDTRDGTGGFNRPVGQGQSIEVQVTGVGGVPADGVSAVVMNTTAVDPTAATFLTVWPAGVPRPFISNINVQAGETDPNLVTVGVGANGKVSVYNNAGMTHVIFDVVGFYSSASGPPGSRFHPIDPVRLFDTRFGPADLVVPGRPVPADSVLSVRLPSAWLNPLDATAVVMNVTITEPTATSYLTVFPGDVAPPLASNLNFVPDNTIPNLVVVRVPANGVIGFYNHVGETHVVVDLVGYYGTQKSGEGGRFIPVGPIRTLDTRDTKSPLGPDEYGVLPLAGWDGIAVDADAAVLNVTAAEPTSAGYLTVFPDHICEIPLVSNLNFDNRYSDAVPNLVIVRLSEATGCAEEAGAVDIYNSAGVTHVIVDIFGYFTSP